VLASGAVLAVAAVASLLPVPARAAFPPTQVYNYGNGLCLDDYGYSTAAGAKVVIWPCNGGSNQQWIESTFTCTGTGQTCAMIQNQYSHLCLDVKGGSGANGTLAIQWPCNPTDTAQEFFIQPATVIAPPRNWWIHSWLGPVLDDPYQSAQAGTQVWFWNLNYTVAQVWYAYTFGGTG
jgi:hypothetical protein